MKRLLFFFLLVTLLPACNRKILIQEAYQLEDRGDHRNNRPTNDVDIKTSYAGDALRFMTFQVDVVNNSDETIILDVNDVALMMDVGGDRRRQARPMFKNDIIRELEQEAVLIEQERKSEMTQNVIFGGASIITGILTGADAVDVIANGSLATADVLDRNRQYRNAGASVEEQIYYHQEYSLDRSEILPGEDASFDVHFERPLLVAPSELEVFCEGHTYDFYYQLDLSEEKIRRR